MNSNTLIILNKNVVTVDSSHQTCLYKWEFLLFILWFYNLILWVDLPIQFNWWEEKMAKLQTLMSSVLVCLGYSLCGDWVFSFFHCCRTYVSRSKKNPKRGKTRQKHTQRLFLYYMQMYASPLSSYPSFVLLKERQAEKACMAKKRRCINKNGGSFMRPLPPFFSRVRIKQPKNLTKRGQKLE